MHNIIINVKEIYGVSRFPQIGHFQILVSSKIDKHLGHIKPWSINFLESTAAIWKSRCLID